MILYSGSNLSGSNRRLSRLRSTGSSTTQRSLELCSSRFSQHGSTLSHLNNNLLHHHMMNTTMNRQEHETLSTHTSSVMVSLQFNNLILGSNFEPKIAGYSHGRLILPLLRVIRSPLSVDDLPLRTLFAPQ